MALGEGVVRKIDHRRILRNFPLSARGDGGDEAVLNKEERVLYFFLWRIETISAENDHIAFASTARLKPCRVRSQCVISVARKMDRASGGNRLHVAML